MCARAEMAEYFPPLNRFSISHLLVAEQIKNYVFPSNSKWKIRFDRKMQIKIKSIHYSVEDRNGHLFATSYFDWGIFICNWKLVFIEEHVVSVCFQFWSITFSEWWLRIFVWNITCWHRKQQVMSTSWQMDSDLRIYRIYMYLDRISISMKSLAKSRSNRNAVEVSNRIFLFHILHFSIEPGAFQLNLLTTVTIY